MEIYYFRTLVGIMLRSAEEGVANVYFEFFAFALFKEAWRFQILGQKSQLLYPPYAHTTLFRNLEV